MDYIPDRMPEPDFKDYRSAYRRHIRRGIESYREFAEHFLDLKKEVELPMNTALDIGSGIGELSRMLHNKGYSASGIDIDIESIKIAQEENEVTDFVLADAHKLPIENESIGLAVCYNTMHHLEIDKLFKECIEY